MKRLVGWFMTAIVTCAAAGCAGSQAGTPHAESSSVLTSAPVSATPPSSQRPRPLDLTGVDPCTLLTKQQLTSLAAEKPLRSRPVRDPSVLAGSPACDGGSSESEYGFLVVTSSKMGLLEFLSKIGPKSTRKNITVKGFPAVEEEGLTSSPESGSGECYVNVDVADGQLLRVQFSQIAASPAKRLPIETVCAKAREVAEAALTTLQGG